MFLASNLEKPKENHCFWPLKVREPLIVKIYIHKLLSQAIFTIWRTLQDILVLDTSPKKEITYEPYPDKR